MHADLVRPSCLEPRLETGEVAEALEDAVSRHRALAPPLRPDRHAHPVVGMTADRGIHDTLRPRDTAVHHREIAARHRSRRQLRGERVVGGLGLGDHEQARRLLVEPVHHPGAARSADARDLGRVRQERRREGAPRVSRTRVDHHARRFVDHQHVAILVRDGQGNRLGYQHLGRAGRHVEGRRSRHPGAGALASGPPRRP